MSTENLERLIGKAILDPEFRKTLLDPDSYIETLTANGINPEDFRALAGLELTDEIRQLFSSRELSDDDLEQAAGGGRVTFRQDYLSRVSKYLTQRGPGQPLDISQARFDTGDLANAPAPCGFMPRATGSSGIA